jgi:hypothetical protein
MDPNALRYEPASVRDHVESYFLKANDPEGMRALWVRGTIFARASEPGGAVAEGWAIAFDRRGGTRRHVALKSTIPVSRASLSRGELGVAWDEPQDGAAFSLRSGAARGHVARLGKRIGWDLTYQAEGPALELLPYAWMYGAPFPKSKLVTPVPDTTFAGEVEVGGERWSLDGWRGMQGHNWGRGNADLYAWCHVNLWDGAGEPLVLEAVSARVRTGPVLLPLLTLAAVRARGVDHRFHRPADMARAKASIDGLTYRLEVASDLGRLEAEITADPEDMVGLYYANPKGPITHCYNSKLARARLTFEPAGRSGLTRTSSAAALEIGTHERDPAVMMLA